MLWYFELFVFYLFMLCCVEEEEWAHKAEKIIEHQKNGERDPPPARNTIIDVENICLGLVAFWFMRLCWLWMYNYWLFVVIFVVFVADVVLIFLVMIVLLVVVLTGCVCLSCFLHFSLLLWGLSSSVVFSCCNILCLKTLLKTKGSELPGTN